MKIKLKARRRFAIFCTVSVLAAFTTLAGVLPNQVPEQEAGIDTGELFLSALDRGDLEVAYGLVSMRARSAVDFRTFSIQVISVRTKLGREVFGRSLVTSSEAARTGRQSDGSFAPEQNLKGNSAFNSSGYAGAFWTIRFRAKTRAGAIFEDVQLEFEPGRGWRVFSWRVIPATY